MWSQKGREDITNQSVVREKLLDFLTKQIYIMMPHYEAGCLLNKKNNKNVTFCFKLLS